jgi:hypothetical protein
VLAIYQLLPVSARFNPYSCPTEVPPKIILIEYQMVANPVLGTKMAHNPLNFNGFIFLVGQIHPLSTPFYHVW